MEKGISDDIVELRLKHYQNRQIDLINRVLEERRKLSNLTRALYFIESREQLKEQMAINNPGLQT